MAQVGHWTGAGVDGTEMTIPFREFTSFEERNIRAEDPDSHNYQVVSDWDPVQYPNRRRFGEHRFGAGTHYEIEYPMIRITGGFQALTPDGLEKMVNYDLDVSFSQEDWDGPDGFFVPSLFMMETRAIANTEDSDVNWSNFSGRYKDKNGSVVWAGVIRGIGPAGPERLEPSLINQLRLLPGDLFLDFTFQNRSYDGGTIFPSYSEILTNQYSGIWPRQTVQSGPPWIGYALQVNDRVLRAGADSRKVPRAKLRFQGTQSLGLLKPRFGRLIWHASGLQCPDVSELPAILHCKLIES